MIKVFTIANTPKPDFIPTNIAGRATQRKEGLSIERAVRQSGFYSDKIPKRKCSRCNESISCRCGLDDDHSRLRRRSYRGNNGGNMKELLAMVCGLWLLAWLLYPSDILACCWCCEDSLCCDQKHTVKVEIKRKKPSDKK